MLNALGFYQVSIFVSQFLGSFIIGITQWSYFILQISQIKTESGAKVKANKTGIYKKWKERSHNKISLKGISNGEHDGDAINTGGNKLSLSSLVIHEFSFTKF